MLGTLTHSANHRRQHTLIKGTLGSHVVKQEAHGPHHSPEQQNQIDKVSE